MARLRRFKKGKLPGGVKRTPANKTWRKGHRSKKGKWIPGKWVYKPGKIPKSKRKIVPRAPRKKVKPSAKPKPKKLPKVPRPPTPTRAKPKAKPKPRKVPKPPVVAAVQAVRKVVRKWNAERKRRARIVAKTTKASVVQADALIRRAKSKGVAWDRVNWDRLQGKDLTFAGRVRRLTKMVGRTATKSEAARMLAADRAEFREQRRKAKRRDQPGRVMAARERVEEEEMRRLEHMERVLMRN